MKIATVGSYWSAAVRAAGHDCIELPPPPNARGFLTSLDDRVAHGTRVLSALQRTPVDLILDTHGTGLLFVARPPKDIMSVALHRVLQVPLLSFWGETLRIYFKHMDPAFMQQAFQAPDWHKAVFTRAHLREMEWLRIPGCFYLPLAAAQRRYPTAPAVPDSRGPLVLFAGSQQSRYFAHGDGVDTRAQVTGLTALAAVADGSASSFLEVYQRQRGGPRPPADDDYETRAHRTQTYYGQKLFYSAARNLCQRDRFVRHLKRALGEGFLLVGDSRWRDYYHLEADPRVDDDEYFKLLRTVPLCLCVVNGDNETGLNQRHFEVTAAGGFLLSYAQPELAEHFQLGRECDVFHNEPELLDKIRHYIAHPEQRQAIASAGQQRTLKCHRIRNRLDTVLQSLRDDGTPPG